MPGSANLPRSGGAAHERAIEDLLQHLLDWRRQVDLVLEGRVVGTLSIGLFDKPSGDIVMEGRVVGRISQGDLPEGTERGFGAGPGGGPTRQGAAGGEAAEATPGIATGDEAGPPMPNFCSQPEFELGPWSGAGPDDQLRQGMAAIGTMLEEAATGFRDHLSALSAFLAKTLPASALPNPLLRRAGEDEEAFQHRLFDSLSDITARAKHDPDGAYAERLQLREAIESDPDFEAKLGAYLQNIDPEFYADPQAFLRHHNLPPGLLKEIPRAETGEIVAPAGEDRVGFFIRNNGNLFEKITADGKVYDTSAMFRGGIIEWLFGGPGGAFRKAPPPLYAVYAHNNLALQEYEAHNAGAAARAADAYIAAGGLEAGQSLSGLAATLARPFRFSRPSAPVPRPKADGAAPISEPVSKDGPEPANGQAMAEAGGGPGPGTGSAPDQDDAKDTRPPVVSSTARVTRSAEQAPAIQKGGAHGDVKGMPGYQSHHMPGNAVSPLPINKGPAIAMETDDHIETEGWGSSKKARAFRKKQADLIAGGDFKAAQKMGIDDVVAKFGTKYDEAIKQMLEYTKKNGY